MIHTNIMYAKEASSNHLFQRDKRLTREILMLSFESSMHVNYGYSARVSGGSSMQVAIGGPMQLIAIVSLIQSR